MLLTAIEFLSLAFFLGMVAGAVLEQLARPRLRTTYSVPTVAEAPADEPTCSFCGSLMIAIKNGKLAPALTAREADALKCLSCGKDTRCS